LQIQNTKANGKPKKFPTLLIKELGFILKFLTLIIKKILTLVSMIMLAVLALIFGKSRVELSLRTSLFLIPFPRLKRS